jgi:hypothetical protein
MNVVTQGMELSKISNLGNLTISDDLQRSTVVKLINDLLTAKIPVTTINDPKQGLPFQEIYYDFDGRYLHLNLATISRNTMDITRDLLLEISGYRLGTYLQDEDPILESTAQMLANRFAAFPLSFVIIEEMNGVNNNRLKLYLDRILACQHNRVNVIWTNLALDGVRLPFNRDFTN